MKDMARKCIEDVRLKKMRKEMFKESVVLKVTRGQKFMLKEKNMFVEQKGFLDVLFFEVQHAARLVRSVEQFVFATSASS